MRGTAIKVISHREITKDRQNSSNPGRELLNSPPQPSYLIAKCLVAHRLVKILPMYINCTQHLGHTDDSRSGVKMFLRVVILVFAATCCRARVIGKSLHIYTLVHSVGNRSATDGDVKKAVTA